jgi:phosphinothricin acetyltransferase
MSASSTGGATSGATARPTFTVRDARLDDLAAIVAIYNQAVEDGVSTCDLSGFTAEQRLGWFEEHHGRYRIWVAATPDRVLGWIALSPYDRKPCFARTGSIATYVDRGARLHGVGSALRTHLREHARRLDFHTLVTRVWATNEASIALSDKFGWKRVGCLSQIVAKDGEYIDCFLYQTMLGEGGG